MERFSVSWLREKYLAFFVSKGHLQHPSGSLVPYDVTGRLDESLLFNGAGMIQFKPYFRGTAEPQNRRLTTVQKCIRTGDIDEVGDDSHLTFFEMLGNFSFGDYFKLEAIDFSWEFLTSPEWLGLDRKRLAFTVFEDDDDAFDRWTRHLTEAGIQASGRVFRKGEESNFWPAGAKTNGPPGPCGPNSEMFYWVSNTEAPPGAAECTEAMFSADEEAGRWLEIWNDVFISYEWQGEPKDPSRPALGFRKTGMPDLPFQSIDTGMGLERTAAVLRGLKSVYETDAFTQILSCIESLSEGKSSTADSARASRIIADHIRAAVCCIADGILPSNGGRGYVLRRLIRRSILQGVRGLGLGEGFLKRVGEAAIGISEGQADYHGPLSSLGSAYPELIERQATIGQVLDGEEQLFRRTLHDGMARLEQLMPAAGGTVSGEDAFKLYDTFGFPLEITLEIAAEAGCGVDIDGYEECMKEAQERSRAGQDRESVYGGVDGDISGLPATVFTGYSRFENGNAETARVIRILSDEKGSTAVLDRTPFYASSGGQIYDEGTLTGEKGEAAKVVEVVKKGGVFFHRLGPGHTLPEGGQATAAIDLPRRRAIQRGHTATHLLHAALHEVVGKHASQAGSYVGPDRLRFDFTHNAALSNDELDRIERIINGAILDNTEVVTHVDMPIAEAKARGAMALFGEKYGNFVRLVEIGEFSRELCGGTHVKSTGEIGQCRIIGEGSAGSGIRRIEAITGLAAFEAALKADAEIAAAAAMLKARPADLTSALEKHLEHERELKRQIDRLRSQSQSDFSVEAIDQVEMGTILLDGASADDAAAQCDAFVSAKPNRVALSASTAEGRVMFACKVGPDAQKSGANAGGIVRAAAQAAGGGGGGSPVFATAGGKDASKAEAALESGKAALREQVGG